MARAHVVLASLFALAATPSTAVGAWSAPEDLSSGPTFVALPSLAFGSDGSATAAWNRVDRSFRAERGPGAETRFDPPTPAPSRATAVLRFGPTGAADASSGRDGLTVRLEPGGVRQRITRSPAVRAPSLTGDGRGALALAWFEDRGTSNDRVMVTVRRPHGAFARPILLATGRIRGVSTAIGARGDVLVAWDARGTVRSRIRRAGAHAFSPVDTIRSEDAYFAQLRTAVAPSGEAVVAWSAQKLTEGGGPGPGYVQAAVRPAGAGRFRTAELLERFPFTRVPGPAALAVERSGRALVAWSGGQDGRRVVRVAATDARARFGDGPQVVSEPGPAQAPELALGPRDEAVLAWGGVPDADQPLRAATAPAGGPFGAPELVSEPEEAVSSPPAVAFDPRTGLPAILWSSQGRVGGMVNVRFAIRRP